jgi:thiol-disulfide isomerase/thioredoxin
MQGAPEPLIYARKRAGERSTPQGFSLRYALPRFEMGVTVIASLDEFHAAVCTLFLRGKSNSSDPPQISGERTAVVNFWATWAGACKTVCPTFEQFSDQHPDLAFFKVDVDDAKDVATEAGALSVRMCLHKVGQTLRTAGAGTHIRCVQGRECRRAGGRRECHCAQGEDGPRGLVYSDTKMRAGQDMLDGL